MANKAHLARLKQGVVAWNQWREENPEIYLDLAGANLSGVELVGAILDRVNLTATNLSGECLAGVDLTQAHFIGAAPDDVDFHVATIGQTIFASVDLSTTRGRETVQHSGPSSIDIETLYSSKGQIPEVLLRGVVPPRTSLLISSR